MPSEDRVGKGPRLGQGLLADEQLLHVAGGVESFAMAITASGGNVLRKPKSWAILRLQTHTDVGEELLEA